jgi:hypothetical protein
MHRAETLLRTFPDNVAHVRRSRCAVAKMLLLMSPDNATHVTLCCCECELTFQRRWPTSAVQLPQRYNAGAQTQLRKCPDVAAKGHRPCPYVPRICCAGAPTFLRSSPKAAAKRPRRRCSGAPTLPPRCPKLLSMCPDTAEQLAGHHCEWDV